MEPVPTNSTPRPTLLHTTTNTPSPQIAITIMIPFGEGSGSPAPAVAKAVIKEYLGLDYTPTNTNLQTVLAQ